MTTSPPEEATNPPEENTDNYITLWVNNLPLNCDEKEVQAFFEKYGQIINISNRQNRKDRNFSGNSFVTFANREDGERAIQETNNTKFKDNIIQVEKSKRPYEKNYKGKPNNPRRYRDEGDPYIPRSARYRDDRYDRYPPRVDRHYDMPMYRNSRQSYYGGGPAYYEEPYSRRGYREYGDFERRPSRYDRRDEYDDQDLRHSRGRSPPRYSSRPRGNDSDE